MSDNRFDLLKRKSSTCLIAVLSALITFLAYLPTLQNEFVGWDDDAYIFENPHILSINMAFFRWAFLSFYDGNWHPLTWLSHAIDYVIWGLNPMGHHLTNIILHAVNTPLVVLLAVRLIEENNKRYAVSSMKSENPPSPPFSKGGMGGFVTLYDSRFPLITAGVTGLLFGLHPLHVESVAWASERKDLLCALFFLLSIRSYMSYQSDKRYRTYLFSLGFFLLALMSKPMAVTLPVVLLILDWYPFKRIQSLKALWKTLVEKIPFVTLSLISSVLTVLAQRAGEAIVSMEVAPLSTRALVAVKSLIAYLWKMLLPLNLIPFYPYPRNISFFSFESLLPIFLVMGITIICVGLLKKQKLWLSVWGYYVVTLIPVIGMVQVGNQSMADRYTYLPGLGPFLIIGLGVAWASKKVDALTRRSLIVKLAGITAAIFVFVSMIYLTINQTGIWKNSIQLWSYVIENEPEKVPHAYNNRGIAYADMKEYDQAIADYNKAIELNPRNFFAYNNRGIAYFYKGRYDQAIADYNKSIEINPKYDIVYYNMACLYSTRNNNEEACKWLRKSIENGYDNWQHIKKDLDLDNIRDAYCFKEIMAGKN